MERRLVPTTLDTCEFITFTFHNPNMGQQYVTYHVDRQGNLTGKHRFTSSGAYCDHKHIPGWDTFIYPSAAACHCSCGHFMGGVDGVWFWGPMPDELYYTDYTEMGP